MLSDVDIIRALHDREIAIEPYDAARVQPASVDLTLGTSIVAFVDDVSMRQRLRGVHALRYNTLTIGAVIDPAADNDRLMARGTISPEGVELPPGMFMLATTAESVRIDPSIVGRLEGKSSLGRLGLMVHSTAGFIDPGFSGTITLELANLAPHPIRLRPGMAIAQIAFMRTQTPTALPYGSAILGSKYQGQDGATASRSHRDRDWTEERALEEASDGVG